MMYLTEVNNSKLQYIEFETPIGTIQAIADETGVYLIDFTDSPKLELKKLKIFKKLQQDAIYRENNILNKLHQEIDQYFKRKLKIFETPVIQLGSEFQKKAWNEISKIPYGQTKSYKQQATSLNQPLAYRAVANANGSNCHCIIVPCHRIISNNGSLGGYSSGQWRKEWLVNHEKSFI